MSDTDRLIGRVRGNAAGPTLLVVAAIHGNEPAGVHASRRVLAGLAADDAGLRGDLTCVVGNVAALTLGVRQQAKDLNRAFTEARIAALGAGGLPRPLDPEDAEFAALLRATEETRAAARGAVHLLDVHTTSGVGPAFSIVDASPAGRAFGRHFPLTRITGLVEWLEGTMLVALARRGVAGLVVECGQNAAPESVDRAEAAIWIALVAAGLVDERRVPSLADARRLLDGARDGLPPAIDVVYRHAVAPADRFRMEPGFRHFQRVEKGRLLAKDVRGDVVSPEAGYILMPLYQATGSDGFFIGK